MRACGRRAAAGPRGARRLALVMLVAAASWGAACGPRPRPAAPGPSAPRLGVGVASACPSGQSAAIVLCRHLEALFAEPALRTAVWSVRVESLDRGDVLYRLNPDTLVVPASNTKIVTMAVGAARLGWDHRYETRLETSGDVVDGELRGDLVVVGGGDPTINGRTGDRETLFAAWAEVLRAAGIRRVAGRLVGNDDAFDDERYGDGWSWDDFTYGYAAPVGALQYNENLVQVVVRPGPAPGDPATVTLVPPESGLLVANRVTTGPAGAEADVDIARFPGRPELRVTGTVPAGGREETLTAAVDNPTLFFVRALRAALAARGIEVTGDATDIDELPPGDPSAAPAPGAPAPSRRTLAVHVSPPLAEIGKTLMKASQNLYAETVLRTLSLRPGPASAAASGAIEREVLAGWGLLPGQYSLVDGSGLSRLNFVSASTVVRILREMAREPRGFAAFVATLPTAGRDGTLAGRLKATRAEANATAKTGTLRHVRALSGYVTALDGERLVFSIIANNFTAPTRDVDKVVDAAVARLADFSRR